MMPWVRPKTTAKAARKHQGASSASCTMGTEAVAAPTTTLTPRPIASTAASRSDSLGAPTRDTMATRLAPMAMAIATDVELMVRATAKTPTTGSAVMMPLTGAMECRSIRNDARRVVVAAPIRGGGRRVRGRAGEPRPSRCTPGTQTRRGSRPPRHHRPAPWPHRGAAQRCEW